ncbi:DNA-binding protein WhiA [Paenibacillus hunanensis]|uniref:Probable cell division protein WhiA n=1 Tax=Paenibacillus hunanensis TaxID=539262 RepID=A0ABU1J6V9_9BACL|nr:DNA-binding protein WhiA [Paenibacillus hunanensis]MCL9663476.1 DNA-binding protein WhiA [Paenibacillus hunanensis]MDR6246218.1 DNA-binding protein WhiA [Paenibacillus hunanensis]WPP41518.1 DNA-binding protein WhiA [Paenibacillus hunanensis]GGJ29700.1 putative sporulation transcription regulator WhiA [Paenibacillus hunanensis]
MSFAAQTKKELTMIEADDCCEQAELSALIRMNGSVQVSNKKIILDISTENAAIARRIYSLIKKHFAVHTELLVRKKMRLKKNNVYIVRIPAGVQEILSKLKIVSEGFMFTPGINKQMVSKNCCKRAYLRGAFMAGGSVNNPEGSSYHLEIASMYEEQCQALVDLANEFDLNARCIERKKGFILYIKEGEKIIEFLSIIGAHQALFKFEDVRIMRDMRNSVNRIVNCETANLNKTIGAAVRQIDNIRLIQRHLGLEQLPDKLREVAEIRLAHPDMNLKEVGEMLKGGVSKSGVNHRLRKIDELAEKVRNEHLV